MKTATPIDLISQGAVDILTNRACPQYRVVIRPARLWLSSTHGWWVSLQVIGHIATDAPIVGWTGSVHQPGDGIVHWPLPVARAYGRVLLRRARRALHA